MWECELFSRGLIMSTGHCKEFSKPIFQALVVTQKERLTLKMSALETLHGGWFVVLTQLIKPICNEARNL